jgi:hypothetical protein
MNRICSQSIVPTPLPDKVPCRYRASRTSLVLLAAGAAITTSCCKKEAPAPLPPPIVQVMEVTATNMPMATEFIGQLDSPQNVEIRARVEAFVDKVLYSEQELFTAELNLAQTRLNELLSVVQLYRALGGGWQNDNTMAQK